MSKTKILLNSKKMLRVKEVFISLWLRTHHPMFLKTRFDVSPFRIKSSHYNQPLKIHFSMCPVVFQTDTAEKPGQTTVYVCVCSGEMCMCVCVFMSSHTPAEKCRNSNCCYVTTEMKSQVWWHTLGWSRFPWNPSLSDIFRRFLYNFTDFFKHFFNVISVTKNK